MRAEIDLLHQGEVTAFYHFYSRFLRNYPNSAHSKADMILYTACEFATMDFNDKDTALIYLLESKIFEDPEYSGHFLSDFGMQIRDGAAVLKDAVAVAKYIRQNNIMLPMDADQKPDIVALSALIGKNQSKILEIQKNLDKQAASDQFLQQSLEANQTLQQYAEIPEWKNELFFHLREYRFYLESTLNTQPDNQTSIILLDQILNSKNQYQEKDVKKFISLQQPKDGLGQALLQNINKLLTYIFNKQLYKQYEAFNTYRTSWQASKPTPPETSDKENQTPNLKGNKGG